MYRLLIADDEGIMLESLKSMISRQYGDEVEIETAKTGRSAIEQAEYFRPDIILMDIQMPGINGIAALREIRSFNQTALFYIISAYDKFDYAKEAIDLGVERYLTKPVSKKVILDLMEEATRKVNSKRRARSDQLKVQEKLETIIPVVENGFISNLLLSGDMAAASYYQQLLDVKEEYACAVVFRFGDGGNGEQRMNSVKESVKAQEYYSEIRAVIKSYCRCLVGGMMADSVVTAFPLSHDQLEYEERVDLINQIHRLVERLEERLPLRFRAGIGRARTFQDLRASYQEALIALQEGKGSVVHTNDIITRGVYEGDFPITLEKELFAAFDRGDVETMRVEANRFFDWMLQHYPDSRDNIRLKVLEFVLWAERDAFHEGAINYGFEKRSSYLTEVMKLEDYDRLREWFLTKMEEPCRLIATRKQSQTQSVTDRAMQYIQENYGRELSLDEVSRAVNVSPYYFSKLFKEEAGENFIDFLTRVRMDHAKELLRDETLSIKEIGFRVGYTDPNYFSRIFKKQTNMTPREWRERL